MSIATLLRQPLLHFLTLGMLLFALYDWREGGASDEGEASARRIVVTRESLLDFIQYRARAFDDAAAGAQLDAMSAEQRETLIDEYVHEEALYREALALGMEQGDYIIRQRLVQKVEFLLENLASVIPAPDDATLDAYFQQHQADYEVPASYTFTHIFFDAQQAGMEAARNRAERTLTRAASLAPDQAEAIGDRFPFLLNYEGRTRDFVLNNFGDVFLAALDNAVPGTEWQGPFESRYGQHLVLLRERQPARMPTFIEARQRVLDDYRYEAMLQAREEAEREVVAEYEVAREL